MAFDVAKIEERLDKTAAGSVVVSQEVGGIQFQTMLEVMEFSKLMAMSGAAVPSHLRGNPGACLAVSIQALEWKMSPFSVANKSYLVNNKGEERIAYESQLIHAVIEARSPLAGRLRFEILGEGDDRRCKVYGTFKGETEPHIYISEPLGKLREARGRNDYGKLKGSPLWDTQPEVQLFYSASRQWCRLYAPDVLLGVYAPEELDNQGPDNAKDVTKPDVASRLKGNKGRGFSAQHVERESRASTVIEASQEYPEGASGTPREAPSAGSGDADLQSTSGTQSAPPSNSSEPDLPKVEAQASEPAEETKPPSSAGEISESSASGLRADDAEGSGADTALPVPSLPEGTMILYAAALRRAQKKESLAKYAKQFWDQHGGWDRWQSTPDGEIAAMVFNVFRDHFGNREQIELQLRELI